MWQSSYEMDILINKDGQSKQFLYSYETPYMSCINKLFSKIGDLVSASRRKSQPLDFIHSKHLWGFYFYTHIKEFILTGKYYGEGLNVWHSGETVKF